MGVTQSVSVGFFVRAERWRGDSFVVVSVGGGVTVEVASGTDAAMVDAEELEPLRRTSQLPAAGASDLIEVFTLRTRISVPSLFEEAVRLEHYALAFRNQGVSWKQASEGNGVVAVH